MKVYIETLGCPKNFNDTDNAKGILLRNGFEIVDFPEDSNVIMVNTCGFINDAKRESIEKIFDMVQIKGEDKIVIVSGCLSKRYGEELFDEIPEVDIFIGVNDYYKLPELIKTAIKEKARVKEISQENCDFCKANERFISPNSYTATIKIAEGCNNRCTYCIIPYIRGDYRSREMEDIIEEAKILANSGVKEIILIAQDVTYYGEDLYGKCELPKLLKEICKIDSIEWVRLMYCYEDRITDELIETMASESKICNYIDIPIQHGSDKMLSLMKRRSTSKSIRETVGKLRNAMPNIHIRTTLITGFPGETAKEFDELYDFVEELRFERLGVFAYSKEEGTPAAEMKPQVRKDVKARRCDSIMRLQNEISLEINQEKIDNIMRVIVEEQDSDGSYIGRTEYDAPEIDNSIIFTSDRELKPGDMVNVLVTDAFDYDLVGKEVKGGV